MYPGIFHPYLILQLCSLHSEKPQDCIYSTTQACSVCIYDSLSTSTTTPFLFYDLVFPTGPAGYLSDWDNGIWKHKPLFLLQAPECPA